MLIASSLLVLVLSGCTSPAAEEENDGPAGPVPLKDYGTTMVACMSENGWDVSTDYTNSVFPADVANGIPVEQATQYESDLQACTTKFGFDETRKPTSQQLEDLYALEVEARDCIVGEGYPLPEMPSLATFKDTYGTSEGWDPVKHVPPGDPAGEQVLFTKCPPPGWFLPF